LNIIIYESDKTKLEAILTGFIEQSSARLAMIVDNGGMILTRKGDFNGIDIQPLAALTAGSYASTQALAKVIGETEFTGVTHQGKRNSMFISMVAKFGLLVVVFDANSTIGMVRLSARETIKKLEPVIAGIISRSR